MDEEFPFEVEAVPEPIQEVDYQELSNPPSTDDFFLFERIDGSKDIEELCNVSGLGREQTLAGLKRLHEAGLVDIPGADAPPSERTSEEQPDAADSSLSSGTSDSASEEDSELTGIDLEHLPVSPEEYDYDPELLDAEVPIEKPMKRELMCLHGQLDELNHYEFFGVESDAEPKTIKMSYFQLSKRYHPDKHYGDDLGRFEEMLEDIFQKITRAYRTLSDSEKRAKYDAELAERRTDEATPMNRPNSVGMANEEASSQNDGTNDPSSGTADKRSAAFAKLVKEGEKRRKRGEFVKAAEAYRKALSLQRELKVALQAARVLLRVEEHSDQAELFARAALRIDDSSVEAYMLLGRALENQGRVEQALEAYDSVLELEPDHEQAEVRRKRLVSN